MRKMDRRMEGWEQAALPGQPILLGSNRAIPGVRLLQPTIRDPASTRAQCRYSTAKRAHCITRMPIQIIPVL